jgi:hypothetical protein
MRFVHLVIDAIAAALDWQFPWDRPAPSYTERLRRVIVSTQVKP